MSKRRSLAALVAFAALLGAACGGEDDGGAASGGGDAGGGPVTLTAKDFAWDPGSLAASVGSSIEVVNEDDAKHNLTIEEAGIDEDVDAGASTTVDLGDLEPGGYDFVCEYHPDTMKGTIEVE